MPIFRRRFTLLACTVILALTLPNGLISQTNTQWTGTASTSWNNLGNWNDGIPSATKSALISTPSWATYVPVPSTDTARTNDLTIQQNGYLYFDSDGVLIVHGQDLTILNLGKIYLGNGTLIARSDIKFSNGGDFYAESGTLEFAGVTWNNKSGSSFDPGTSTVVFNGSGNQFLIDSTAGAITFYDLQINTQGTVTISGDVRVTNSVYVAAGCTLSVGPGDTLTFAEGCSVSGGGTIAGGGTYPALPVQMTAFTATANRLDAILRWGTATEVNNFGFEIQRRFVSSSELQVTSSHETRNPKPGTTWSKVGFVQGSGTSTSPKEYSFIDVNLPAGRYAYRIKQIDLGGAASYYDAAEVEVGLAPKELSLGPNYPNPFNPATTIEFTLPEAGHASLKVFNMIGQEIATLFNQNAEAGRLYRAEFSASSLPSGLYFYRLEFGKESIVKRMTLVK